MFHLFQIAWWQEWYRRHRVAILAAQAVFFIVVGMVVARWWFGPGETVSTGDKSVKVTNTKTSAGPTLWTCSMHPQIRSPKPGLCPLCGMDLIPVEASTGGMRTLTVSPAARALMSIETAPVERRYVEHKIPLVGKVDYDETKLGYITAWIAGRLDRLFVDYTGVTVKRGDHMVYIYSEELYAAQEEFVKALEFQQRRGTGTGTTRLSVPDLDYVKSAREKLRLLGVTDEQIKELERTRQPSYHLTIYSPVSGVVIEKLRQEGERVKLGDRIYTIADLSKVWVHLDAYESDLAWIHYGQDVVVTTEAYPGEEFHGRIAFIQPVLDDRTRTVKVRVNVPNPTGRLKPMMFVHAVIKPKIAAGGRVIDPSLAGKWISPMHPEIIKDKPGKCDICGMPLVRAESLGFVSPQTDTQKPPLVIPYQAALTTGTRAIVYVELPYMHSAAEPALQTLKTVVDKGGIDKIRRAFATYGKLLDRPYDQPGTDFARNLWNEYADRLAKEALAGQRAVSVKEAKSVLQRIETIMERAREVFAPVGQPTFEGREIVLGPRAGDYYLVRHGLQEGEMVVTQGNFKIDSEIQIKAKPSMMTPEGGGGGGHQHGGGGKPNKKKGKHQQHQMAMPPDFANGIRALEDAYDRVTQAMDSDSIEAKRRAFREFLATLEKIDAEPLTGHLRMQWKEFAMLLGNDGFEGAHIKEAKEADRVYLLLKNHMRRVRESLKVPRVKERKIEHVAVGPQFQQQLARIWKAYLPLQRALADDDFDKARQAVGRLQQAVAAVQPTGINDSAKRVWHEEHANLEKIMADLGKATDLSTMRQAFKPLAEEVGVLAKSFGFGPRTPVFELYCSMAFEQTGAIWYQDSDDVRNPYFGSEMLRCADRVDPLEPPGRKPTDDGK